VFCALPLPTEPMEIHVVVVSIQVEALEECLTPKPIPLIIPQIIVGVEVTLIFSITHAFEVFRTPNIKLKDTPIIKRVEPQPIFLVESIDTTSE